MCAVYAGQPTRTGHTELNCVGECLSRGPFSRLHPRPSRPFAPPPSSCATLHRDRGSAEFSRGVWTIEPGIELGLKVMRLIREHRAEWSTRRRESAISAVHVLAVLDCGLNSGVRVLRYARLDSSTIPPSRDLTSIAEATVAGCELCLNKGSHSLSHTPVIRWAIRFY
jgi:hypothetical protein